MARGISRATFPPLDLR